MKLLKPAAMNRIREILDNMPVPFSVCFPRSSNGYTLTVISSTDYRATLPSSVCVFHLSARCGPTSETHLQLWRLPVQEYSLLSKHDLRTGSPSYEPLRDKTRSICCTRDRCAVRTGFLLEILDHPTVSILLNENVYCGWTVSRRLQQ